MPWQAAIQHHAVIIGKGHRGVRCAMPGKARHEERIAGIAGGRAREMRLAIDDIDRGGKGRLGIGRQWHHGRDRRAVGDLRIGQRTRAGLGTPVHLQLGAGL